MLCAPGHTLGSYLTVLQRWRAITRLRYCECHIIVQQVFEKTASMMMCTFQNLEAEYEVLKGQYADANKEVPKPSVWGGYCLVPSRMEFWQGHSSRLHDRIVFRKISPGETPHSLAKQAAPGWVMERLYPWILIRLTLVPPLFTALLVWAQLGNISVHIPLCCKRNKS